MPLTQPIPQVTPVDVERIVRRDFSADDYATVMTILDGYGRENWHRERERVQLAALKVANASIEKLRACIESAGSRANAMKPTLPQKGESYSVAYSS